MKRLWVATVLGIAATAIWAPTATGQVLLETAGANTVPGSYIVTVKPGANTSPEALAAKYSGTPKHAFSFGFSVESMSEQQARELAMDPAVAHVERNVRVSIQGTQTEPVWGLDRIDQRKLPFDRKYTYPNTAKNVTAYVIDTGIRKTHAEFDGRASYGYNFVDNNANADDCYGHGTHVAGTIAGRTFGVAKEAEVVGVKVLGCDGTGTLEGVVAGIDWVTKNGKKPAVVNMSLGGNGQSQAMEDAVRRSIAAGFTYAIAGGNDGLDACGTTPARVSEAITVGASDNRDRRSVWSSSRSSNWGKCIDIWAPGSNIVSAYNIGDTRTTEMGGTSMATPHVAGAAALYLSAHPNASNQEVRDVLVRNATPNLLTDIKDGSPNVLLHVTT